MKVKPAIVSGHFSVHPGDEESTVVSGPAHGDMGGPQRILVPVDFNECSKKALLYAAQFARQTKSRVILLHVLPARCAPAWKHDSTTGQWLVENDLRRSVECSLARKATDIVNEGVSVEIDVRFGSPARVIAEVAGERDVNLIIMGTHGYKGLLRAVIGSVANSVTRLAPCPVLIVRETEKEFSLGHPRMPSHQRAFVFAAPSGCSAP